MPLDDPAILAALRGSHDVEAVCRTAGVTQAAFAAARDALLRRHARLADATLTAAVGAAVTIRRDRAGIPHIAAARTPDLFFGLGLAMAQDRLWQMDRLRRRALGRQAEILGPAYADSDAAHLTVGIDRIAEREASAIDAATASLVVAFVAGINRWIEAAHDTLPIEFAILDYAPAPFTVRDIVAIGRGIWWSLNGRIDRIAAAEAARFVPEALRGLYLTPEASENIVRCAAMRPAPTMRPAAITGRWRARAPRRASRSCAAIRTSRSGCRRAGTSSRCTDPRIMPPAPAIPACPACGGAATAPPPGASPTTPPPPATSMWRRPIRATGSLSRRRRLAPVRDAHGGNPGARRGHAPARGARDAARPDRECADPHHCRGRRPAAVAALGRRRAHRRHARGDHPLPRPRLGRRSAPPFATGRSRCSTSSMPTARGTSAIRWRDASRCAGASCPGFATPASRPTSGADTSPSTTCRAAPTRSEATSPAPTSGSCRPTIRAASMAPIRRAIAACASTRRSAAARGSIATPTSSSRTTSRTAGPSGWCPRSCGISAMMPTAAPLATVLRGWDFRYT